MSSILPALPAGTGNAALDEYTKASLGALAPGGDYTQTDAYKSLQGLLGAPAGGGLNPNLMAQYQQGAGLIGQQTGQNVATAQSNAQGRGLGQSSIAAQGVENAQFGGQMADASLMASLYGQQNQNNQQLAGYVAQGSQQQLSDLLGIYNTAGVDAANMAMYTQGLQEALQAAQISGQAQQNAGMFGGLGSMFGPALGSVAGNLFAGGGGGGAAAAGGGAAATGMSFGGGLGEIGGAALLA